MTYEINPSAFAALITSVILFVTGLSVLLKSRRTFINRAFFLYSISLFFYFASFGLMLAQFSPWAAHLRLFAAVSAGLTASWFFKLFLFGKSGQRISSWYYIFTTLVALIIAYNLISPNDISGRFMAGTVIGHVIISAFSVFASITQIIRTTHAAFVRKRLQYLSISSAVFIVVLLLTHTPLLAGRFVYVGHMVTGVYMYFLGQTILQRRFMDLHELLTRTGILVGIMSLISMVFYGLLFWIPTGSGEFLLVNIVVGSLIVLLLMEPFEKLSGEWVRFFFWRRRALGEVLESVMVELDYVQESVNVIGSMIMNAIKKSQGIEGASLYLLEEDRVRFTCISSTGLTPPPEFPLGSHREMIERLNYNPYLLKDEVEQELDRLRRGWAISLGVEALQSVLDSLEILQCDVAISIRTQNRFVGILALRDTPIGDAFSESDVMLFRQLAKKIGSALENTERFKRAKEQERLAMVGKMASGLAHEIRNPLGAIKGAAQLLADEMNDLDEEKVQFLNIITEETQRLGKVVSTYLEFSRSESFPLGSVDLGPLLNKIRPMVGTLSPETSLTLTYPSGLASVRGNEDKIKQVLLNLILNGIQSMEEREEKNLEISVDQSNGYQWIHIKDCGCGMESGTIEAIFDPFFTTREEGTGLGLPICKKIVQQHGGEIRVTSSPGKGTLFSVSLPEKRD